MYVVRSAPPNPSPTRTAPDSLAPAKMRGRGSELTFTIVPAAGEGILDVFGRVAAQVREADATPLKLIVFGSLAASNAGMEALRRVFGPIDWPVMWIEGTPCGAHPGNRIAGVQVFALASGSVQRIVSRGRVAGCVYETGGARHCLLGAVGPGQIAGSGADQAKQTFDAIQELLSQGGFTLADTVRTWFYNDDLIAWYPEFNAVRNQVYSSVRFRTGSLPASTGIGGRNPSGAALSAGLWAMQPLGGSARAIEVASPLQCPAPAYGSSFSRAIEMTGPSGKRLLISGTASISPDGATLWKEDASRQVSATMDIVEAMLNARGFEWNNVNRATAYFKRGADSPLLEQWCESRGVRSLPVIPVECEICRDDLLFELEADAWLSHGLIEEEIHEALI